MDGSAGNDPTHSKESEQLRRAGGDGEGAPRNAASARLRFGAFEADLLTRKLHRGREVVRLQEKPFQVLAVLLENAGSVVTREEIRARVWPDDDYLDFDGNLNTALNKLRRALGDLRDQPAFIRTIPRTGYLFIATVVPVTEEAAEEMVPEISARPAPLAPPERLPAERAVAVPARRSAFVWTLAGAVALIVALGALALRFVWPYSSWASRPIQGRAVLLVLPFDSPGGDSTTADFADGLSDVLITRLSEMNAKDLGVIARTTATQYRNVHKTAEQIGRELHVDYLLEGTVRRDAQRERVFLWLVRTRDQVPVWAETYDRGTQDALSAEDEISSHVAAVLGAKFFGSTGAAYQPARSNPEAREDYLEGRYFWNRLAASDLEKALNLYQSAIRKDPGYAEAYVGVAETYAVLADWTLRPPGQTLPAAREAARTALERDPALAEAHAVLGAVAWQYDHDWARAEAEFSRALQLSPSDATVHQWRGEYLAALGRFTEANSEMEAARQLDPLSRFINTDQGYTFYLAHEYARATAAFQRALELDPNFYGAHIYLAWTHMQQKQGKEAAAEFSSLMDLRHSSAELADSFRQASAGGDTKAINRWILERQLKRRETGYSSAWRIATCYAALGEKDQAFQWMEKALEEHDPEIARLRVDPMMDPLRGDARFPEFLARLNLR